MIKQKLIRKYNGKIPLNELFDIDISNEVKTNSWFDIKESNNFNYNNKLKFKKIEKIEKVISCEKIVIKPTEKQTKILLNWFTGYRQMYNETLHFLNTTKDVSIVWNKIRTNNMINIKNMIRKKYSTPSHLLDYAIKSVCSSFKSAFSNLKNKNIKHFKIRFIKDSKNSHILDLEKTSFSTNGFYTTMLGKVMLNDNNYNYKNIKKDAKLHYDKKEQKFTLLIPVEKDAKPHTQTNSYISIDPGVRTFLTGLSNNKVVEIGKKMSHFVKKKIKKIDSIVNNVSKHKKYIEKHKRKIKNKITDMHWKSINYLTNGNYSNILIGNWSTKSCISNRYHLNKKTKRTIQSIRYFDFLQKLKFKCDEYNISLNIVDESYTSKTCSHCGIINQKLGSKKTFKCPSCNIIIDRDLNGCRNILIKSF